MLYSMISSEFNYKQYPKSLEQNGRSIEYEDE